MTDRSDCCWTLSFTSADYSPCWPSGARCSQLPQKCVTASRTPGLPSGSSSLHGQPIPFLHWKVIQELLCFFCLKTKLRSKWHIRVEIYCLGRRLRQNWEGSFVHIILCVSEEFFIAIKFLLNHMMSNKKKKRLLYIHYDVENF